MLDVVIVAYNPEVELLVSNVSRVLDNELVNKVYIIDNSNITLTIDWNDCRVLYHPLNKNTGIAKAQNIGISDSLKYSISDAVVLFDQDSVLENKLLDTLYQDFIKLKSNSDSTFAAIGPQIIDSFTNKEEISIFSTDVDNLNGVISVREIIASGKMINKKALEKVGMMDESLFIDGVDHEWCWRAKMHGYKVYVSNNSKMVHTVGGPRKNLGVIQLRVPSPIRMYYQYRNYFILSQRSYTPLYWKFRNLAGYILKLFAFCIFDENKVERRKYILSGVVDGIKGKKGSYYE